MEEVEAGNRSIRLAPRSKARESRPERFSCACSSSPAYRDRCRLPHCARSVYSRTPTANTAAGAPVVVVAAAAAAVVAFCPVRLPIVAACAASLSLLARLSKRHMATLSSPEYKRFRSWVALRRVCTYGSGGGGVMCLRVGLLLGSRSLCCSRSQAVDHLTELTWTYYDHGPSNVAPLVMLPGLSGTADVYFRQFLSLCPKGYRLLSVCTRATHSDATQRLTLTPTRAWVRAPLIQQVQSPAYQSHSEWVRAFDRFLDSIQLQKVRCLL